MVTVRETERRFAVITNWGLSAPQDFVASCRVSTTANSRSDLSVSPY